MAVRRCPVMTSILRINSMAFGVLFLLFLTACAAPAPLCSPDFHDWMHRAEARFFKMKASDRGITGLAIEVTLPPPSQP